MRRTTISCGVTYYRRCGLHLVLHDTPWLNRNYIDLLVDGPFIDDEQEKHKKIVCSAYISVCCLVGALTSRFHYVAVLDVRLSSFPLIQSRFCCTLYFWRIRHAAGLVCLIKRCFCRETKGEFLYSVCGRSDDREQRIQTL